MHKTKQSLTRPNKISDMSKKLHVSTYIYQHPNQKHTAETYSINITLDVKPQHPDINTYSLNQLEDDKHIYQPTDDSQKKINTSRVININQTPERLNKPV